MASIILKTVIANPLSIYNFNTKSEIVTYPNPAGDVINIASDKEIIKVEIFDISGRIVASQNGNEKKVDVAFLASGNYLLKVYDSEKMSVGRFVKE